MKYYEKISAFNLILIFVRTIRKKYNFSAGQRTPNSVGLLVRSIDGSSLLQIVIAMGIFSVLAAGMASLLTDIHKQQSFINQRIEKASLINSLNRVLAQESFCNCNFSGINNGQKLGFSTSAIPSNGLQINQILKTYSNSCDPNTSQDFFTPNQRFLGSQTRLDIGDVTFKNILDIDGVQFYADLEIRFIAPLDNIGLRPIIIPRLILRTAADSDFGGDGVRIESCTGEPSITNYPANIECVTSGAGTTQQLRLVGADANRIIYGTIAPVMGISTAECGGINVSSNISISFNKTSLNYQNSVNLYNYTGSNDGIRRICFGAYQGPGSCYNQNLADLVPNN